MTTIAYEPTQKQWAWIRSIEKESTIKFQGTTKAQAAEFIKNHKKN